MGVADFLWNILAYNQSLDGITLKNLEQATVRDFLQNGKVRPACIDTAMENLLEQAKNQNFVPVLDDHRCFIGIITRKDVIRYLCKKQQPYTLAEKL